MKWSWPGYSTVEVGCYSLELVPDSRAVIWVYTHKQINIYLHFYTKLDIIKFYLSVVNVRTPLCFTIIVTNHFITF